MDYLERTGIYHSVKRLPHRPGLVQCTKCDENMSTATIETIISTCAEDMRFRLTRGETEITSMLDRYHRSTSQVYNFFDLDSFIDRTPDYIQRQYNPYNDLPVIVFVSMEIFALIRFDPLTLEYAVPSMSRHGYYVGFISQHASRGFFTQASNILGCADIIRERIRQGTYYDHSTPYL